MRLILLSVFFVVTSAFAEEDFLATPNVSNADANVEQREPATALPQLVPNKRHYAGGADEEDLQVQTQLPEAALHTDSRSLQREVYKSLYNEELKDERQEAVEE